MKFRVRFLAGTLVCSGAALAQQSAAIERVKLGDNELKCAQLHGETLAMDKAMQDAKAAEAQGNTTSTAGMAGAVAAQVAQRTGLFAQMGGLLGHVAGPVAAQTAATATQQSGQQAVQLAQERGRQALARKEHVTAMFISRGCKTSDLSYNPPPGQEPKAVLLAAAPQAAAQDALTLSTGTFTKLFQKYPAR